MLLAAETGIETAGLETVGLLPEPAQAMRTYVQKPRCHAAVLSRFLDGEAGQWYCETEKTARLCSRCHQLGRWGDRPGADDVYVEEDTAPFSARGSDGERQTTTEATATTEKKEEEKEEEKGIGDDNTMSETSEEWENRDRDTDNGIGIRPTSLRRCLRDEERGRRRYVQQLRQWQGLYMICRLLGGTGREIRRGNQEGSSTGWTSAAIGAKKNFSRLNGRRFSKDGSGADR